MTREEETSEDDSHPDPPMKSMETVIQETIIQQTKKILKAIQDQDWTTYAQMCDEKLTAFEPEAEGHLVEGLDFHYTYFKSKKESSSTALTTTTVSSPNVRVMGNVAVIAYIRLIQRQVDGQWKTFASEETRVWERRFGGWILVHFHRSVPSK
eukprot:TRINITY_DN10688_c0_g1_i1.p1 TRINITY_DN10688_c0_g1~~TRINITY_DN10688_c0_g1_i1.p1  ORF type:complete len:176 (+),score=37.84 TRINITY_DN10688_c0_g1_i1:72-530(+)